MAHVTVTIAGRPYRMACADGEEGHLEELGRSLDEKIDQLRGSFGEIGDQRITVMAALTLADELAEARRRIAAFEAEKRALLEAHSAARTNDESWIESVAEALSQAAMRLEEVSQGSAVAKSAAALPQPDGAHAAGER